MMKTTKVLSLIAAGFCFLAMPSVFAQTDHIEVNRDENGKIVRGPYLASQPEQNWFIELGAGPSMYLGGLNDNTAKRIAPAIDLTVGKFLTPEIAIRLAGTYTPKYREFSQGNEYNFYYWGVRADFMWDMITTIGGYKTKRVYTLLPYVGAGYAQLGDSNYISGTTHAFTLTAGLINKFRLCDWVDFNIELRGTAATGFHDRIYNWKLGIDAPVTVLGGFTFNLGKRRFVRASTYAADQVAAATAAKDAQLAALAAAKAKVDQENENLKKQLDELSHAVPDTVVRTDTVNITKFPEVVVFFDLAKSTLNPKEESHFKTFVYYVKYTIANGSTVTLVGSADKQTGTAEANKRLSKERAELVKKMLVESYGIPADKLETTSDPAGSRFDTQEMNRCVYVRF